MKTTHIGKTYTNKFHSSLCNNDMTFEDCELAILRQAVDDSELKSKSEVINGPHIAKIISILEKFLIDKKLICYGGTAINNILPKEIQFYDRNIEIPDYDFYSTNAMNDSIELADIYFNNGYTEVEAKSGVHYGTFKVFVNFIPIADITFLDSTIFDSIKKEAIEVDNILYAPPNFLRMNMYIELSRPAGDVSRWEKVLKRLTLLNRSYPLKIAENCSKIELLRKMTISSDKSEIIYQITRDSFIDEKVVFFGGYATSLYTKYMQYKNKNAIQKNPDFDVIAIDPEKVANNVADNLTNEGVENVSIIRHEEIGEVIPFHYEIQINKESVAFIYKSIACHSYNSINIDDKYINIATIDTMLTFYLAFYYVNKPYYYRDRIMCMIQYLFYVEQKNRLEQKGLLKRFTISCYGKQDTLSDIRLNKTNKFKELKNKKNTDEYNMWFLKYIPNDINNNFKQKIIKNRYNTVKKSTIRKNSVPYNLSKRKSVENKTININDIERNSIGKNDYQNKSKKSYSLKRNTIQKNSLEKNKYHFTNNENENNNKPKGLLSQIFGHL
jgi:hypothetical protein